MNNKNLEMLKELSDNFLTDLSENTDISEFEELDFDTLVSLNNCEKYIKEYFEKSCVFDDVFTYNEDAINFIKNYDTSLKGCLKLAKENNVNIFDKDTTYLANLLAKSVRTSLYDANIKNIVEFYASIHNYLQGNLNIEISELENTLIEKFNHIEYCY